MIACGFLANGIHDIDGIGSSGQAWLRVAAGVFGSEERLKQSELEMWKFHVLMDCGNNVHVLDYYVLSERDISLTRG